MTCITCLHPTPTSNAMDPIDEQHQGTYQDTEQSPRLTVNHLPDEVLLEIFIFYRQGVDSDPLYEWLKRLLWLDLAHVCRKWRTVVFTWPSGLDIGITVGHEKPDDIKTLLSGHLPIFINYKHGEMTDSALWRMRAPLGHHDRVREIAFEGTKAWFDEFFKATNCSYPVLESLKLHFEDNHSDTPEFLDTFLRGPDLSDLRIRRLELNHISLSYISGFLLSTTALTDLTLTIDTFSHPRPKMSFLLACLQGVRCLRSLDLTISHQLIEYRSPSSAPENTILLPNLTRFRYDGVSLYLDELVARISAPSLRDIDIQSYDDVRPLHLSRFINEIKERYHTVHVTFHHQYFQFQFRQSKYIGHCESRFNLGSVWLSPGLLMQTIDALSTRFGPVEELHIFFDRMNKAIVEDQNLVSWRRFYELFPSVKVLRTGCENNYGIARTLLQDHGGPDDLAFLPALEEIDPHIDWLSCKYFDGDSQLAAFQPFTSAREQAGFPVKVLYNCRGSPASLSE